jgi:hypothetical protein
MGKTQFLSVGVSKTTPGPCSFGDTHRQELGLALPKLHV